MAALVFLAVLCGAVYLLIRYKRLRWGCLESRSDGHRRLETPELNVTGRRRRGSVASGGILSDDQLNATTNL